ncbi:MAG: MFS transporter [Candidatus Lambdaproteobacteria bacterium]|nr:MFS transporter [Candidatus Lambdaproteobacteria bacterium]
MGMSAAEGTEWQGTTRWLAGFCLARLGFSTIFTTYAAAMPLLIVDWHMTASQAGLVNSAYHLGYLTSLFIVGFLADSIGAKRTYLFASIAAASSALTFAFFAHSFHSGLLLYGLTGLLSGGSYTPGLTIIAQQFHPARRGRAIGFYLAAASAGYAASLLLSSIFMRVSGWRAAFLVTALGPLAGALMGYWMLRGTANVIVPRHVGAAASGMVTALFRNNAAVLIVLSYVFHSWELLGLWAWIPFFLAFVAGGGRQTAGAASLGAGFSALTYLVSVGGPILGGTLSDRVGRGTVIIVMATLSVICSFTIGWLVTMPLWLVVLVAFLYQFTSIADSPVLSTAVTEVVEPRYLGAAYSIRSVLGFGAGAISPWVFGMVVDWGRALSTPSPMLTWGLAFGVLGLGGCMAPLCILRMRALPGGYR